MKGLNRIKYIAAHFVPIGKEQSVKVPTGKTKKTIFGNEKDVTTKEKQWVQTGYSDKFIDGKRLAQDLKDAVDRLNTDGFEVISVTPVNSGNYGLEWNSGRSGDGGYGWGFGYGYSFTEGLIVTARKIK